MPTYSYRCTECGEAFDIQQAFTDDTLTVCPNCGGALRKLFNSVGVTFNGSGFYRTDSRAKPTSEGGSPSAEAPPAPSAPAAPAAGKKESTSTVSSAKE
jgi:putative FmdB family regulatory protein